MSQIPPLTPPGATQGGGEFPTAPSTEVDTGGGVADPTNTTPPPFDPSKFISDALQNALLGTTTKTRPPNPELAAMEAIYFQIWGQEPPGWRDKHHGYVGDFLHAGWNLYEFTRHEMSKPAFKWTQFYRDRYGGFAEAAAQLMGQR